MACLALDMVNYKAIGDWLEAVMLGRRWLSTWPVVMAADDLVQQADVPVADMVKMFIVSHQLMLSFKRRPSVPSLFGLAASYPGSQQAVCLLGLVSQEPFGVY